MLGLVAALVIAGFALAGCSSDDETTVAPEPGNPTEASLVNAYEALTAAADEIPDARLFPKEIRGEVEVVESGKDVTSDDPDPNELMTFLHERGVDAGITYVENEREADIARSGLIMNNQTRYPVLIMPADLEEPTASEIIDSGGSFATLSKQGELLCISSLETGAEPCPLPDDLQKLAERAREKFEHPPK